MDRLMDFGRQMSLLCCDCNQLQVAVSMMHTDTLVDRRFSFWVGLGQRRIRWVAKSRFRVLWLWLVLECLRVEWRCCFPVDWQWTKDNMRWEVNETHQPRRVCWLTMDNKRSVANAIRQLSMMVSTMEPQLVAVNVLVFSMHLRKVAKTHLLVHWDHSMGMLQLAGPSRLTMAANSFRWAASDVWWWHWEISGNNNRD